MADDTTPDEPGDAQAGEADHPTTKEREESVAWLMTFLSIAALTLLAVLFVQAWLRLPEDTSLTEPVAPGVESEVMRAMREATTPADRANLRLQLADLEQQDAVRRSGLRNSIAQVGTALLAGFAAAWAAVAAWRQLQENRKQADYSREDTAKQLRLSRDELRLSQERTAEELRLSREQVVLSRDAQVAERFTRAVDQLGNDNADVRIGGIYALERIAHDSASDRSTILEVVVAYIRGHAHKPEHGSVEEGDSASDRSTILEVVVAYIRGHAQKPERASEEKGDAAERVLGDTGREKLAQWAPDVQAALTVLGRFPEDAKTRAAEDGGSEDAFYLRGAYLRGANLRLSDLWRGELRNTDLQDAKLNHADLRGANLRGANLRNADLRGAHLDCADLPRVKRRSTKLKSRCTKLWYAQLAEANLEGANLRGADLRRAHLEGAQLEGAVSDSLTTWGGFDWRRAGVVQVG